MIPAAFLLKFSDNPDIVSPASSTRKPAERLRLESERIPTRVQFSAKPETERWWEFLSWQRVKDSNPHIQSQSLLCYLYTNPLYLPASANRYYYTEKRCFVKGFFRFFGNEFQKFMNFCPRRKIPAKNRPFPAAPVWRP